MTNKKKKLAKAVRTLLITIAGVVVIVNSLLFFNPLLRSAQRQRGDILRLTPIGTSMEDVLEVIERRGSWSVERISHTRGFIDYRVILPNTDPDYPLSFRPLVVGEQHIRVYLGQSWALGHHVQASWGFDRDGRLIDVYIRKSLAK